MPRPRASWLLTVVPLLAVLSAGCRRAETPEEKPSVAGVKWGVASNSGAEERVELVGTTVPLPERTARVAAAVEGRVAQVLPDAEADPATLAAVATTVLGSGDASLPGLVQTFVAVHQTATPVEGQLVFKGALLVVLDDRIPRANLARLEANQDVLREELLQSEYAVALAQAEWDRLGKLSEGLKSPVDVHKAEFALKDAKSKLNGSRGKLQAGAREIDALREQLRLYRIRAPIAGRVGRIQVAVGQALSVGTPITEVVDVEDQIDVLCFVPPALAHRLEFGQEARGGSFKLAIGETPPSGRVAYIAHQAEPETGNVAVKIRLDNSEARLRANRILHVTVVTRPATWTTCLPLSAILEDEEMPTVVLVEDLKKVVVEGKEEVRGVARRLQVQLGVRDRSNDQVEILSLEDPEKESEKKWKGNLEDTLKNGLFVLKRGQGIQTGDLVKLAEDDD